MMTPVKTDSLEICPCQSGKAYRFCCNIIHLDLDEAELPEQLMKARYSAFVLCKEAFILNSWAFETRPEQLLLNDRTRWISLEITGSDPVSTGTSSASVSFIAKYLEENKVYTVQERSTFIKRSNCWYYLDGDSENSFQVLGGNTACPCGSGKKFKRCCRHNS